MRDRGRSIDKGSSGKRSAFIRGDAGRSRTEEELDKQKRKAEERKSSDNKPFRFYVPVGETRQIIVTDDKPDFFLYEHALKDSDGKWGRLFTGCVKEFANCPVCESTGRESYYAMILSCIDLTPFETRAGDRVEFSRKLLVVKPAQQKKFLRFFNKEGTLRGAVFDMTRDGDKDSSIGNDIEFVEFVPEEELADYTRSWKDREGKKHTEDCSEPYVYEDLFEEPDEDKLRAIVGAAPTPGSREADRRELGGRKPARGRSVKEDEDDDWEDAEDDGKAKPATKRRKATDDDDDLPFDPDKKPSRTRAPVEKEPAPSRTRGKARDEEEDEDEDEEDDKPQSRAARRRR